MLVELPCRLGPFLLLRHLASGGMGAVYLAHERRAGAPRLCVVKTVRSEFADDRVAVRRFVDEARTSALLLHPNIVAVYDVGDDGGTAYIAVEYVPGRDLMAIFLAARRAGRTVPEAVALHVIAELLDALDHAHHATDPRSGEPLHVVHRDVSPQNVLVGFDGDVKLIDFGIARCAVRNELTHVGQLVGKLRYISPEQARGEPVGPSTDVWAACVTACELLTGQRFWGERAPEAVAPLLAAGAPVAPAGFDRLNLDVQEALGPGLDVDATVRPSAAALRDRLRELVVDRGLAEPQQQARALLEELFTGEREREHVARAALLREPTAVRAAALPGSAPYQDQHGEPGDGADDSASTGQATLSMRPSLHTDTVVFEPTRTTVSAPAPTPRPSGRRRASRARPAWLLPAAAGAALLGGAAIYLAVRPVPAAPAMSAFVSERASPALPVPVALPVEQAPPDVAPVEPGASPVAQEAVVAPMAAAAAAPVSDAAARPARKAAKPRKVEPRPRLFGDRVRALKECSPRPRCATSVLRDADDVLDLSVDELRELDDALERCLARCR